jgi:tetrahydromethanopterin S-methyltransferase subunit G
MALEQRISRLEGAYEQVDKRLDDLGRAVESLRSDLNSLRSEMNGRFNNIYVLIGASWVTLIGAMIGLYFK